MNTFNKDFVDLEIGLLWRALKDSEPGMYVDIGAGDPVLGSITRAFYEHGWRGVNVEPDPDRCDRFRELRPLDVNLQFAVAAPSVRRVSGRDARGLVYEARTLKSILTEYARGEIHFLRINADGSERETLHAAALEEFRPWIVIVDTIRPANGDPTSVGWTTVLHAADYQTAYSSETTRYFVRSDKVGQLAPLLQSPLTDDDPAKQSERLNDLLQSNFELQRRNNDLEVRIASLTARLRQPASTHIKSRLSSAPAYNAKPAERTLAQHVRRALTFPQRESARFLRKMRKRFVNE